MGNALQKASPSASNKHTVLNNSQISDAGNGERSLLNITDDNAATMLINDPRSPTEGINRTPIQVVSRSKSLFRGMFSGRKPPEMVENAANANAAANTEDEKPAVPNGHSKADEATSVTVPVSTSTPLNEKTENAVTTVNGTHQKNGEAIKDESAHVEEQQSPLILNNNPQNGEVKSVEVAVVVEAEEDVNNSQTDHDITTENEEAFIVVDNKKKKKKREKAEAAKAKADAESKVTDEEEQVERQHHCQLEIVTRQPLTKGYSDSKLACSKDEETESGKTGNGDATSDAHKKQRLSNANENDIPSSFRVKVEKACRSLTNLSSKSKTATVNGNGKQAVANGHGARESGDETSANADSSNHNNNSQEPCATGASAPSSTTSPLVDIVQRDNVDCNGNSNGKYMVLVNDE